MESRIGASFSRRGAVWLIYFTLVFTGFAGVSYEVIWHKYLANLFGSQARATALILSIFLGGLSVGYFLFGLISKNKPAHVLVKICAWLEIGIGIWAIFFHDIYSVFLQFAIHPKMNPSLALEFLQNLGVGICLLGVPTILMGGTLPLLTQALSLNFDEASKIHARIYAINTAGAFLGAIVSGFLLIPFLGLPLSMLTSSVINLSAGVIILGVSSVFKFSPTGIREQSESPSSSGALAFEPMPMQKSLFIAFVSGFCSLTLQSVFIRLIGMSVGSSEYAFSMVVGSFILMLAIGAWRARDREITQKHLAFNQGALLATGLLLYFTVSYWPYLVHLVRITFSVSTIAFYVYHLSLLLLFMGLFWFPVGLMGRMMPYLFSVSRSRFDDLGKRVGWLYAVNTIGCVLGATLGGYALFTWLNMDQIFQICLILFAIGGTLAMKKRFYGFRAALSAAAFLILLVPGWDYLRLNSSLFRMKSEMPNSFQGPDSFKSDKVQLLFHKDGANTSVAILENTGTDENEKEVKNRSILVNGKSDGTTTGEDLRNMRLTSHLPMLLHPKNSGMKAAVVGQGTGVTVGSLTLYPEIESINLYEISPTVAQAAPYFDAYNHEITRNPKVRWIIGDAYKNLAAASDPFDLIISEPSNPWVVGVEKLFAAEFYTMVTSRLDKGGLFAQWINAYDISTETLMMVFKTFHSVFPHVRGFWVSFADLVLIGSLEPIDAISINQGLKRFNYESVHQEMREMKVASFESLATYEFWLAPEVYQGAEIHSLEIPKLAYKSGFNFFANALFEQKKFDNELGNFFFYQHYPETLANLLLTQMELKSHETPAKISSAFCRNKVLTNLEQSLSLPRICRSAMARLFFKYPAQAIQPLENQKKVLHWINPELDSMDDSALMEFTSEQAEWGLLFAERTASGMLTYKPKALLALVEKCQNKNTCYEHLLGALMANGRKDLVQEVVEKIPTTTEGQRILRESFLAMTEKIKASEEEAEKAGSLMLSH